MPQTRYILADQGWDRSGCLAIANPNELVSASYEIGNVYSYDGLHLTSVGSFLPSIFGSWVYSYFGGDTPAAPPNGGIQFLDGAYGGVSWVSTAFSGDHGLDLGVNYGGEIVFNTSIGPLNYQALGTEQFTSWIYVVDTTPAQILLGFYVNGAFRYVWWTNSTDLFGFPGTGKGSFSTAVGSWIQLTFTAADLDLMAGDRITGLAWGVYATVASNVVFSDTFSTSTGSVPILTTGRFVDCSPDGSSGFYVLNHTDNLYHFASPSSFPSITPLPGSGLQDYKGCTLVGTSLYVLRSDGTVFKFDGANLNSFGTPSSGLVAPATGFYNDGTLLYTLFAANNEMVTINATTAVYSGITSPFLASLDALYVSGTTVLTGGSNYIKITNANNNALAFSVATSTLIAANTSGNQLTMWNMNKGQWTLDSTHAAAGNPVSVATTGAQALVSNASGTVQVFTNAASVWTPATVSVTSPAGIAITPDGAHALVCQGANNTIQVLNNSSGTWTAGQVISGVTAPTAIAIALDGQTAIVNNSTGVSFLNYNGVNWLVIQSIVLSPIPTVVATDSASINNAQLYGAGKDAFNALTIYGFDLVGNTWTWDTGIQLGARLLGNIVVVDGQIVIATTEGTITVTDVIGSLSNTNTFAGMGPSGATSAVFIAQPTDFTNAILIGGLTEIWELYNDGVDSVRRTTNSLVGIYSGSAWTTVDISDRNKVSSLTADTSGHIYATTMSNELVKITSGAIVSGYPYTIIPPVNQEEGVPLGTSRMVWWQNAIYASTSLNGGLISISSL